MNSEDHGYCRLCAELKPNDKLINLHTDHDKRHEILEKLTRINAVADFSDEILPKTVCFVCKSALDRAFEFVLGIDQAQGELNNVFFLQQIKKESTDLDFSDDNFNFETTDDLKNENVDVKLEPEIDSKRLGTKTQKKNVSKTSLDTIPLSELKRSWKDYSWKCTYCETLFANFDELKTHSVQYHSVCNAFRCTDCNIRKFRLDRFLIHIKRHRKYLKLSCYKCNARFLSPYEGNSHRSVHKTSDHICPGCNTEFQSIDELNQHTSAYYQVSKRKPAPTVPLLDSITDNLTCLLCKKTFKHKGSLNTHLLIHTDRKREYTCDKCGKCFLNKATLAGHIISHDNVRPFQCEICKYSFKTQAQLRSHVGVHDNKKPFACEQCGRCFRLLRQLTSHKIIHTDSLPHVCHFCNKRFRFKTILIQHIRQHTGVKPYSCEICQRDFTNWPNYNKHMKRRHGMDMARKKHTPEGLCPINPTTGEVIILPQSNKILEWKEEMMQRKRPGRPRVSIADETDTGNNNTNTNNVFYNSIKTYTRKQKEEDIPKN